VPAVRALHVHRITGIGGSERHLLTLLPALRATGVEPVFVGVLDGGDPEPFYSELKRSGVPTQSVPLHRLPSAVARLDPDLVHSHLVHADVVAALAAGRRPLISTKHNDDPFRTGPFRYVERLLARRAQAVITITGALARFQVERVGLPPGKITVVRYGLDAPPPAWSENPQLDVPAGARVLLGIGRLVPQKGYDVALRAFAAVRDRHPDAFLVLLGEGPERERLERLRGELRLDDAVALPGRAGDVAAWLDRAELLVHPARWEGFGLVLLEAMLAARAVVATRVSAVAEIVVEGETGLLVPPDDADALAAALDRVLSDPALPQRLGAAGSARAHAEFSVARMAAATADVYRRVLARRS
jgi:glycosyltransferase involved in cell wall biosynthesis